ncbi:cytochrome P450 [Colletotrichum caudatum]|nr:cytochrome P450 [Colletotrichum caudatum]
MPTRTSHELQKGKNLLADIAMMYDPTIDLDPEVFNPQAQLVSRSPQHLGFGHGPHACPGRFFAANEITVALAHLLMKYDWKLAPRPQALVGGFALNVVRR